MLTTTSKRCTKTIEKHMKNNKKCIPIIGGDFNAELDQEKDRNVKVLANTHSTKATKEETG